MGGGGNSSSISTHLTKVIQIFSTHFAFAALKSNGSVITWGEDEYGGNSSIYNPTTRTYTSVSSHLTKVTQIFSTKQAFTALKSDGSVVTWGDSRYGEINQFMILLHRHIHQ